MSVEIIHGEALEVLPRFAGQAALVYMDSCFNTGQTFRTRDGEVAFEDRFVTAAAFRDYLEALLQACRGTLAPHGSLVVHCDLRFQPVVRELGDRLFDGHLADQVVWHYRRWPVAARRCNRVHDYLIRYVLDERAARWTQLYQPLAESTRATWGTKRQKAMVRDGVRRRSIATDEESKGAPIGDVWSDIGIVAPSGRERNGFPTQKPEKLLHRVISLWTEPGDKVIDPTSGSGTCARVAAELGRDAVAIDRSEVAIRYTRERLSQVRADAGASPARKPFWELEEERAPVKLEALEVRGLPANEAGKVEV